MAKHSAADFLSSWRAIPRQAFIGIRPDVLFYYPQHFNRSASGTNPYFDAILAACKAEKIRFLLMEESDPGTPYPRNREAMRADALFWFVTAMRKILRCIHPGKTFDRREHIIARILDTLTFHKFRARSYVTISNSMIDLLANLNPMGTVYDLQHGIIYAGHPGYFDPTGALRPSLRSANKKFMIYGEVFRRCFFQHPENADCMEAKVHVVGLSCSTGPIDATDRRKQDDPLLAAIHQGQCAGDALQAQGHAR